MKYRTWRNSFFFHSVLNNHTSSTIKKRSCDDETGSQHKVLLWKLENESETESLMAGGNSTGFKRFTIYSYYSYTNTIFVKTKKDRYGIELVVVAL